MPKSNLNFETLVTAATEDKKLLVQPHYENKTVLDWIAYKNHLNKELSKINYETRESNIFPVVEILNYYIDNFNQLSSFMPNHELHRLFTNIVICAINTKNTSSIEKINKYREFIHETYSKQNYLHNAMCINDLSAYNLFLSCIPYNEINLLDRKGNTFLHLCDNEILIQEALSFPIDIDHCNVDGNTALHIAAQTGNIAKARMLLQRGADPMMKNNKGESFWDMPLSKELCALDLYRLCHQNGSVLSFPPANYPQNDPGCAYNAINCGIGALAEFDEEIIPARKKNVFPKAPVSIRQKAKELKLGKWGIFSVSGLCKVLEAIQCHYQVTDIKDFNNFMATIVTSISCDYPVIIPYANQLQTGKLKGKPQALHAHWAVIIGWRIDPSDAEQKILLAHQGVYQEVYAQDLYSACTKISRKFPGAYLYCKNVTGIDGVSQEWEVSDIPKPQEECVKSYVVPAQDLIHFRGKLVTLFRPNQNTSTVKNRMTTNDNNAQSQSVNKRVKHK